MLAKRVFYVCTGILCLGLAYHLGAVTASAQAPGNPIVAVEDGSGNVFSGAPTPAAQPTWGQLKSRYRPGASAAEQDK